MGWNAADNLPDLGPTHLAFALNETGESNGLFRFHQAGEVIHYGPVGAPKRFLMHG